MMSHQVSHNAIIDALLDQIGIKQPPIPVDRIAVHLGIQLVKSPLSDEMSGFLYREKGTGKTVIGVNAMHAPVRQRFTIAHEIGHFHLHGDEEVHVDRLFSTFKDASVRFRNQRSSAAADKAEIQANRFAAALLMPERFINADIKRIKAAANKSKLDLPDEDTFAELARRYGVSQHALLIRLVNLGHVEQDILNPD